jgi:tRNA pseudouridine55 synthase
MELHGFLNIDKPLGWTSHDVVGRLRKILRTRKIGHAGTLDPAATGVLVVGVGRATRFLDYVQHDAKSYVAHIVLGRESETADIDGRAIPSAPDQSDVAGPAREDVDSFLSAFIGEIDQVPPKYSAIKSGGVPLHRRMRRGENVDVPVRRVTIQSIELISYAYPDLVLAIDCGPGVYIRSLAIDLGERLGTGAYLHHLVRTRVGRFTLPECARITTLNPDSFPQAWSAIATATDVAIDHTSAAYLDENAVNAWYHGRSIPTSDTRSSTDSVIRAYGFEGKFAGIASAELTHESSAVIRPRIVIA